MYLLTLQSIRQFLTRYNQLSEHSRGKKANTFFDANVQRTESFLFTRFRDAQSEYATTDQFMFKSTLNRVYMQIYLLQQQCVTKKKEPKKEMIDDKDREKKRGRGSDENRAQHVFNIPHGCDRGSIICELERYEQ